MDAETRCSVSATPPTPAALIDPEIDVTDAKGGGSIAKSEGKRPALNMVSSSNAYLLPEWVTWRSFKSRGDLAILIGGTSGSSTSKEGQAFFDGIISPRGETIAPKSGGEQLFFSNATHQQKCDGRNRHA